MTAARVRRDADGFDVDAELIGEGLKLEPGEVVRLLREGAITSRVERGEGEDGLVLSRSRVAYDGAPLPPAMRRPG